MSLETLFWYEDTRSCDLHKSSNELDACKLDVHPEEVAQAQLHLLHHVAMCHCSSPGCFFHHTRQTNEEASPIKMAPCVGYVDGRL